MISAHQLGSKSIPVVANYEFGRGCIRKVGQERIRKNPSRLNIKLNSKLRYCTFVLVNKRTLSPIVTLTGSLDNKDSFTPTEPVTHVDLIVGGTRSTTEKRNGSYVLNVTLTLREGLKLLQRRSY